MLREVLNIKWPNVVTNIELYQITNVEKWSYIIRKRRLSWLGHLMRLDIETPARIALAEYCKVVKKIVGSHKLTWIELVTKDLQNSRLNLDTKSDSVLFEQLAQICSNRSKWREEVRYMMLNTTNMYIYIRDAYKKSV